MFVDLKQIKELMTAMQRAGMKRLRIKDKVGFELELECASEEKIAPSSSSVLYHAPIPSSFHDHHLPQGHPPQYTHSHEPKPSPPSDRNSSEPARSSVDNAKYITSPMVGTFYSSSSPGQSSFVKPGDTVNPDTIVCIIEAMKVMNEVKAGISGVISEILVTNGHPVEFGAKLFKITS